VLAASPATAQPTSTSRAAGPSSPDKPAARRFSIGPKEQIASTTAPAISSLSVARSPNQTIAIITSTE